MNRRNFLRAGATAAGAAANPWLHAMREAEAASMRFRYAICNEMYEKQDFAAVAKDVKAAGFQGIEIAPFTLAEHIDEVSAARRRELRGILKSEGLAYVGLHWLLVSPKGLHATTPDRTLREKSWAYLKKLVDFSADMGQGGVMVFGSPAQRASQGIPTADAVAHLRDGLAGLAPHAKSSGVIILLEALPSKDTDVVTTVEQAVKVVKEINHPAIQTMFDFHNTLDEKVPSEVLVEKYFPYIRHVHVNEMDGRHPGTGKLDFRPVFQKLVDLKYKHWVSLEVFDFKPGGGRIVRETMDYYRKMEKSLKG